MSLARYDNDVELDWALSVLLVQTQKKIPVLARDPTKRILDHLVRLLEQCATRNSQDVDILFGFLLNSQAFPGSLRRERVSIILLNAVQVEDNQRIMVAHHPLISALLHCLEATSETLDPDIETRTILYQLLENVVENFSLKATDPFLKVMQGALACKDSRRTLGLSIFSKIARTAANMALLFPAIDFALVQTIVSMLGDALIQQSEFPGGPDGATELEQCLDIVVSFGTDARIVESFFPQTCVVRLLVMFLVEALDPAAPRSYLSLFRKTLSLLLTLTGYPKMMAQILPFFNDILKISCSKSVLAPEVHPLLQKLQ